MAHHKPKSDISFAGTFASSAFAACFAEICTIPLDTAKVRLQLQKKAVAGDGVALPKYKGMLGTVATIAREEGLSSLWKGIVPGLHRQCLFGGLRIGLYEPVKNLYVGENFVGDVPLSKKILAALTTGAVAITVANPTDLVKVRLQAEGKLPAGVPRRYSGALNAYSTIVKQEGVGALWTGLGPNIARNAIINAAELASYDQVKETILKIPGFSDNIFTHLLSGLGAGFFAVCIGSPVDVVKSRMMGDPTYKSTLDCFIKTLKNDGPFAFYKGFIPNFGRLGSWNVIMFLTLEQDVFRYLGSMLHKEGEIDEDVSHRIRAGWMKWKNASGVLCDRRIPAKLKGKFYRTAVRPAMLYGSECWATKKQHVHKMSVAEMRMLRWMCGHTRMDRIRNEDIRRKVGVAPIEEKLREHRLRWFGHIQRRPLDAPVRRSDLHQVEAIRRGRGRPKMTWMEVVKKDLTAWNITENISLDRGEWRNAIRVAEPL